MKQKTLAGSFSLSGKGLHTGLNLTITFQPAPVNHGYKIQRTDFAGKNIIEVLAENVIDTQRGTVLSNGDARCSTVEHGMAALFAAGIDNVLIQVDGPEFPILDGSSLYYTKKIQEIGVIEQEADKIFFEVKEEFEYTDPATGSYIHAYPSEHFSVETTIKFDNSHFITEQTACLDDMARFGEEIASARTFVFVCELQPLLMAGLIKGGDLDNAIVIYERQMSQPDLDALADKLGVPRQDASKFGYLNNRPLTWDNEPARHKVLDIIGDFALIGRPIKGRFVAYKSGHTINNKFTRMVRNEKM